MASAPRPVISTPEGKVTEVTVCTAPVVESVWQVSQVIPSITPEPAGTALSTVPSATKSRKPASLWHFAQLVDISAGSSSSQWVKASAVASACPEASHRALISAFGSQLQRNKSETQSVTIANIFFVIFFSFF